MSTLYHKTTIDLSKTLLERLQRLIETVERPKAPIHAPIDQPPNSQSGSGSVSSAVSPLSAAAAATPGLALTGISTLPKAIPPLVTTTLSPGVITDSHQVTSPTSMTPVSQVDPTRQHTPISRPGSGSSVLVAAGRAPPVPPAPQPVLGAPLASTSSSLAITPSQPGVPIPDLTQTFSHYAKRDAEWFAQHARPILDHHAQSQPTSASAVVPSRTQSLSSTP